jgi:multiple sugar transport system ATP-binding protein
MLVVENLRKSFLAQNGQVNAVDGVSFTVESGKLLTLLGPSGCGKTTTLRCIAGLERPDSGRITIDGRDVYNSARNLVVPPNERGIGMVFQSYAIWPHMTVFENVAFPLRVSKSRKYSRAEVAEKVKIALEKVRLGGYEGRAATQLSGGQQQRLALARGLVREPGLLLLDEPLSNLDAKLREQMRFELKRLQLELGVTTLYVTHDQAEAMSLGDRVAVMRDGRIAQIGTPLDVYDRPDEQFVGGFLGAPPMNFFPALVRLTATGPELVVGENTLPAPAHLKAYADRRVLVGVRAENIQVTSEESAGWSAARVEVVEPTGASVLLTVRLDEHQLKVQAPPGFPAQPDGTVWLRSAPEMLRFYDPETSLALVTT